MRKTVALREHKPYELPTTYCVTIIDNTSTFVDVYTKSKKSAEALVVLLISDAFGYTDVSP